MRCATDAEHGFRAGAPEPPHRPRQLQFRAACQRLTPHGHSPEAAVVLASSRPASPDRESPDSHFMTSRCAGESGARTADWLTMTGLTGRELNRRRFEHVVARQVDLVCRVRSRWGECQIFHTSIALPQTKQPPQQ